MHMYSLHCHVLCLNSWLVLQLPCMTGLAAHRSLSQHSLFKENCGVPLHFLCPIHSTAHTPEEKMSLVSNCFEPFLPPHKTLLWGAVDMAQN